MELKEYYSLLAEELIADLSSNLRIKKFTSNSELLGALAEESVEELVRKHVSPLRISTGSVVSHKLLSEESDLPQLDRIIWQPTPFPALFEKGNFGIVPTQSCVGVLEIKRSNYSGVGNKIKTILDRQMDLVDGAPPRHWNGQLHSDSNARVLGVVCVYDSTKSDTVLRTLIENNDVCTLLEHDGDMEYRFNRKGVLLLVDFISKVRRRAADSDGYKSVNIEYIKGT